MRKKRITHSVDPADIKDNSRVVVKKDGTTEKRQPKDAKQIETFAKILNREMEERNIDQSKMAKDLKISTGAISKYRNGVSEPGLTKIIQIADYLDVDCSYLMTGVKSENVAVSSDLGLSDKAVEVLRKINNRSKSGTNYSDKTNIANLKIVNMVLEDAADHLVENDIMLFVDSLFVDIYRYITAGEAKIDIKMNDQIIPITEGNTFFTQGDISTAIETKRICQAIQMDRIRSALNKYASHYTKED